MSRHRSMSFPPNRRRRYALQGPFGALDRHPRRLCRADCRPDCSTGEARATGIARRLGVSHPKAINTISRRKREGLAVGRPYRGIFLTDKGEALARRVHARHRLVLEMLLVLGVPRETAEVDAEGIEHHVSEATV
ncbi:MULTISPECIES: iron dependent repressor, metal binding and dimerization domain protein [unclassified Bradyrhizobium]|uniref:iron dependent repressor, metal binding and dimerization domain protein n=1 Tax=unclassified Bradyrhizobium TaxID=2631580 RepID=UPI002306B961|nr:MULTISPECIES: iron dependent repressor, metal binding and dimerization domain protein [unclassified Bradyrhizobium]